MSRLRKRADLKPGTAQPPTSQAGSGPAPARGEDPADASGETPALAQAADDPGLLDRAYTQWQFGDWENLAGLATAGLERHPDRAKLALLVACACQQLGDPRTARRFATQAKDWGCEPGHIAQLLVAGVYNTLGRAALLNQDSLGALKHFHDAVSGVKGEARLVCEARLAREAGRLEQPSRAACAPAGQKEAAAGPRPNPAPSAADGQALENLVGQCLDSLDFHAEVDGLLARRILSDRQAFQFFCALSDRFRARKDPVTALHFLGRAQALLKEGDEEDWLTLSRKFIALGYAGEAVDLLVEHSLHGGNLSAQERAALVDAYEKLKSTASSQSAHGHEVLIAHLKAHLDEIKAQFQGRRPVMIEIGTTREDIYGQGSTKKLAAYCKSVGIHFITVDMDPHNSREAAQFFQTLDAGFEAVTQKGEDYLRDFAGTLDFVFLDAYDFDHGQHSELRQSRYRQFLGGPIEDRECHQMHLECAQSVSEKLSPFGLVCVDDTWLVEGQWCAKGTLAMPYLLGHGFEIAEARNRAALLRRKDA